MRDSFLVLVDKQICDFKVQDLCQQRLGKSQLFALFCDG